MNTSEFLTKHQLSPESINLDETCKFFMSEMDKGLKEENSSLAMIDSYCSPSFEIESGKPIIVIDAGGTNFRTCLVTFDGSMNPSITDFQNREMPGFSAEVSAKEFFSTIADATERLINKSDRIGFCFSYAAKILENHDGIPMMFSKEIKASEVIGKELGKELFAEFSRRGYDVSKKKIIILNDTVTTLLAGLSQVEKLDCKGCIGFILGTGTNTAYIEKNTIINVESGRLHLSVGDIDEEFLQGTKNPKDYLFEKMISGAYLGPKAKLILQHAKAEGLINYEVPENFSTKDMDFIDTGNSQDDKVVNEILRCFVERAAKLTAANLAACILFTDYGKDKPVLINADGTTFYKQAGLKDYTEKYLTEYISKFGRKAIFTKIENSPVIGSAIGALSI